MESGQRCPLALVSNGDALYMMRNRKEGLFLHGNAVIFALIM
jgi:hypothetical protein